MLYRVSHATTYKYSKPVLLCQNLAHLTPRDVANQRCRHSRLVITPEPAIVGQRTDYFGNSSTFFTIQEAHRMLDVTAEHVIERFPTQPPDLHASPPWERVREFLASDRTPHTLDAFQFTFSSRLAVPHPELTAYAADSLTPGRPLLEAAFDLTRRIHRDFKYDKDATDVGSPVSEVFEKRRGVCQDFAHVQISGLRSFGLAARYVSGYLSTAPPAGQPRLVGADATHAWVSVYCPLVGWVDFDPTNDQIPGDKHLIIAWGRDYDDVSPVKGVILGGGKHAVSVSVDVNPVVSAAAPEYGPF